MLSACLPPLRMFIIGTGSVLGGRPAEIAIERQRASLGRGLGDGHADAENRVGAELGFVGRAVQLDHELIDRFLIARIEADQFRGDLGVDVFDGLGDALAELTFLVVVAQFDGFMLAGAGAAGDRGPAEGAVFEHHVHFDGGIAAGIENLPGLDEFDAEAHYQPPETQMPATARQERRRPRNPVLS